MAISQQARQVIERPLDRHRVKSRQGGQGMTFDYIPTEYAIQLLNEAFDYAWDSRVFTHEIHDSIAVVGVELKVWDEQGSPIIKQQFGSCNINRGVDIGSALKGAASDGLKKCASQFGLALELYLDEVPAGSGFNPPQRPKPSQSSEAPRVAPRPPGSVVPPPSPPRPPIEMETRIAPPSGPGAGVPAPGASRPNPFANGHSGAAAVAKPAAPAPSGQSKATAAGVPRPNPFSVGNTDKGINSTQMSALTSLSAKKGMSPPDMIALASVVDPQGMPKQTFEELNHGEAIQVIKAAQQ